MRKNRQLRKLRNLHASAANSQPTSLTLTAAATFGELTADGKPNAKPTFSIAAYSGGQMNVGFGRPIVIDVSGLRASQNTPILLDHDSSQIVGQSNRVDMTGGQVRVDGRIMGDEEASRKVVALARDGFAWQASVGVQFSRGLESIAENQTVTVNGRKFNGPLLVLRSGRLGEVSFVAVGADENTSAKVAASAAGDDTMKTFDEWLKANGFDSATLADGAKAKLKTTFDAEVAADKLKAAGETKKTASADKPPAETVTASVDSVKAQREQAAQECERITKIGELFGDKHAKIKAQCIRDGWSFERAENEYLKAENEAIKSERPTIKTGGGNGKLESNAEVIQAALCTTLGLREVEKRFDAKVLEAAHKALPRGMGLQELLLRAAAENGYAVQGYRINDGNLRDVLRAAFSTNAISGILTNVQNKFLVEAFNAVEQTWRQIATTRPVNDFKAVAGYRLTGDLTYKPLTPGGEIQHGTLGNLAYANQAATYGRMLAIKREDIINDDLGALQAIPQLLGRGGALKINNVFWTAFLANAAGTFFVAGNNNVITGGTSALSSGGLALALAKFRKQKDADGNPIGVTPKILLAPPELEVTALELMSSTNVNTGGAATDTKVPNRNIWAGKFDVGISAYLSDSAYTGFSTTAWYLLCTPADLATIEVVFLNGVQLPTIESAETDFDTLGIQVRGYHDFGVALQEPRAGVRAAGV